MIVWLWPGLRPFKRYESVVWKGHWCGRWDSNPHDVAIEGF